VQLHNLIFKKLCFVLAQWTIKAKAIKKALNFILLQPKILTTKSEPLRLRRETTTPRQFMFSSVNIYMSEALECELCSFQPAMFEDVEVMRLADKPKLG